MIHLSNFLETLFFCHLERLVLGKYIKSKRRNEMKHLNDWLKRNIFFIIAILENNIIASQFGCNAYEKKNVCNNILGTLMNVTGKIRQLEVLFGFTRFMLKTKIASNSIRILISY